MTDEEMLDYDFFADDKDCSGIRAHRARVVRVRKPQTCLFVPGNQHEIKPGSRARLDEAVVDDRWARFYSCEACHEAWAEEWS